MKKVKLLNLLMKRAKVQKSKILSELQTLGDEKDKTGALSSEIFEITNQKANQSNTQSVYAYQVDRQLTQKLMQQKEVLDNRTEFLQHQMDVIRQKVTHIQSREDILKKKKISVEKRNLDERELKTSELNMTKKV